MNAFDVRVAAAGVDALCARSIETLQVNVGLRCTMACAHCHLECSPLRAEMMSSGTLTAVAAAADELRPRIVDITGGAPELHPELRGFIDRLRASGHATQVRTNLTILTEPGFEEFPAFFRDTETRLVASLPCYLEENVDRQRGRGAFRASLEALRRLNLLGYGVRPELPLDLVFNPGAPGIAPPQQRLEGEYRRELWRRHRIAFTSLLTITNFPVGRFGDRLRRERREEEYLQVLAGAFNPCAIEGLMCRRQIEVGWDGRLYDCDFNLALGLPVVLDEPRSVEAFDAAELASRRIRTGLHCLACTAGAGTS